MQVQNAFVPGMDNNRVAFPAQGKLRVGYLQGIDHLVRNLGGDPRDVLERQEIDPLTFEDPDHDIECLTAVNLLEYCSRSFQDPLFGLHLAELQDPDAYGCVIALARAAPNLREALQCLIDYVQVSASPECDFELVTGREVAELRWHTDIGLGDRQQVNYHGLLLTMKTLQMLGREHFRPRYTSLTFPLERPAIQLLQERFGCKVYGKAEANAIAFSNDILDRPIATSNRMLFNLLGSSLAQLRAASKAGFVEQVEACVRRSLSSGHCSVDDCAGKLGTSTRTLQKRLTRMGVKFSDIVQNERIKLAKHALLWTDCSLDDIAFQLGYSEQTSFGRAFKRATGVTPKAFRMAESRGVTRSDATEIKLQH